MTAYDQLVEVIATGLARINGFATTPDSFRMYATTIADDLLAAKQTQTCGTCGGTGEVLAGGFGAIPMTDRKTCRRAGVVVGTEPLMILGPEQVGWVDQLRCLWPREETAPRGSKCVPVYRRAGSPTDE